VLHIVTLIFADPLPIMSFLFIGNFHCLYY